MTKFDAICLTVSCAPVTLCFMGGIAAKLWWRRVDAAEKIRVEAKMDEARECAP